MVHRGKGGVYLDNGQVERTGKGLPEFESQWPSMLISGVTDGGAVFIYRHHIERLEIYF